jgi:hypothetical protein
MSIPMLEFFHIVHPINLSTAGSSSRFIHHRDFEEENIRSGPASLHFDYIATTRNNHSGD